MWCGARGRRCERDHGRVPPPCDYLGNGVGGGRNRTCRSRREPSGRRDNGDGSGRHGDDANRRQPQPQRPWSRRRRADDERGRRHHLRLGHGVGLGRRRGRGRRGRRDGHDRSRNQNCSRRSHLRDSRLRRDRSRRWLRRRSRRGRWNLRRTRREQRRRVDVPLRLSGDADAEMHRAGLPDNADGRAFGHGRPACDGDRPELRERDGVAVVGENRDRLARSRDGAGERDRACARRDDARAGVTCDVDAAMLACGVRMRRVERERLENCAVGRPRPCARCGSTDHRRHGHEQEHATHRTPPWLSLFENSFEGGGASLRCQTRLQSCHRVDR